MSNRVKEIILKVLIIVGLFSFAFGCFPGGILWVFLIQNEQIVLAIIYAGFFIAMGAGVFFIILSIAFGGLKQKPISPEKYPFPYVNFETLKDFLWPKLLQMQYQEQPPQKLTMGGTITLFAQAIKRGTISCFLIIHVPELTNATIDESNDKATELLTNYYQNQLTANNINVISLFCVDRVTPAFSKLLSINQQGFKNGRLLAGISFGSKKLYIAKQKDGFAIGKYKKLRRHFMQIMQIESNSETFES